MRKKILSTLFFITLVTMCHAFDLEQGKWYDFDGTLGKSKVTLSLYRFENGEVRGNYCYNKYGRKIQLSGTITGKEIALTELINGKVNGYFKGNWTSDKSNHFEGLWSDSSRTRVLDFKLSAGSVISGGTYENRYGLYGKDKNVENFMKQVKTAILKDDKAWLAGHIRYPLKTYVNKTLITINTKQEFITNFSNIFHAEFKALVKSSCTCNMFTNYQGVMLGQGHIWIYDTPGSTKNKFSYHIIAINNG